MCIRKILCAALCALLLTGCAQAGPAFLPHGYLTDESVAQVEEELVKCGFNICMDKIRIQYVPTKEQLLEIESKVEALVS